MNGRAACTDIQVSIMPDRKAATETSWNIRVSNGSVVYSGSASNGGCTYCVPTASATATPILGERMTITINDSKGNGLCCTAGTGSYKLTVNGAVVASGGNFFSSASTLFVAAPAWHASLYPGARATFGGLLTAPAGTAAGTYSFDVKTMEGVVDGNLRPDAGITHRVTVKC